MWYVWQKHSLATKVAANFEPNKTCRTTPIVEDPNYESVTIKMKKKKYKNFDCFISQTTYYFTISVL